MDEYLKIIVKTNDYNKYITNKHLIYIYSYYYVKNTLPDFQGIFMEFSWNFHQTFIYVYKLD